MTDACAVLDLHSNSTLVTRSLSEIRDAARMARPHGADPTCIVEIRLSPGIYSGPLVLDDEMDAHTRWIGDTTWSSNVKDYKQVVVSGGVAVSNWSYCAGADGAGGVLKASLPSVLSQDPNYMAPRQLYVGRNVATKSVENATVLGLGPDSGGILTEQGLLLPSKLSKTVLHWNDIEVCLST